MEEHLELVEVMIVKVCMTMYLAANHTWKLLLLLALSALSVGVNWEQPNHRKSGCFHLPTTFALCRAGASEYHKCWNGLYILWDGNTLSSAWGLSFWPDHWISSDWSLTSWSECLWSTGSYYDLSSPDTPSMYALFVNIQNLLLSPSLLDWYRT